jgi:hypothetical protein
MSDSFLDKLKKGGSSGATSSSGGFAEKFSKTEGDKSFTDAAKKSEGNTTFVDQMVSKSGHLIYHVNGKDANNGLDATYFVLVDRDKVEQFKKAIKSDHINLLDYGKIIASCYGTEPNERVKEIMKEKYGFDV